MSLRPGQGKGPYVGSSGGGSGAASASWSNLGELTYEDFSSDSNEFQLGAFAIPANAVFYAVRIVPVTPFVLPGASFYNLKVGIAGTLDLYLPDYDVLGLAAGDAVFAFGSLANGHIASLAGWTLYVTATTDNGLDGATAGAFDLAIQYAIVP